MIPPEGVNVNVRPSVQLAQIPGHAVNVVIDVAARPVARDAAGEISWREGERLDAKPRDPVT
jgi:hypothetical protein